MWLCKKVGDLFLRCFFSWVHHVPSAFPAALLLEGNIVVGREFQHSVVLALPSKFECEVGAALLNVLEF